MRLRVAVQLGFQYDVVVVVIEQLGRLISENGTCSGNNRIWNIG